MNDITRNLIQKLIGRNLFLALIPVWVLLWTLPWASWMESFPWIQICISMLIFIIPGFVLSILLVNRRITLLVHFTSGLALSTFIIGLLGLLGRKFHISFTSIKIIFMLFGFVCLLLIIKYSSPGAQLYRHKKTSLISITILLFTIIIGFAITLKGGLELDDFSYMAYLTTWQHSQALDFNDVFFGLGDIGQIRFWLAMFPMSQALLSEISGLHGLLLIGYYLEPLLVIVAILAAYNLYEGLLLSKKYAATALLLHFTILIFSEPGDLFFHHLTQDKAFAAFILAPIFFSATFCFLESFTLRDGIFFLLIGFSITLTHPIMLAYSIFIMALYTVIVTLIAKEYKKLGIVLALLVALILPVGLLRFVDVPWISKYVLGFESVLQQPGAFDFETASSTRKVEDLVTHIAGTPFYGFNPHRIQLLWSTKWAAWLDFISWGFLYILILGLIWSFFNLKQNSIAPFISAVSLLVLFALIPYTGWLMGYFVSARMLWRTPWFYPIGLITAVLAVELLKLATHKMSASRKTKTAMNHVGLILISVICLRLISVYSSIETSGRLSLLPDREHFIARLTGLVTLGDYLESNIEEPSTFLAPEELMYYLPGLSSKSKVVFFREERFNLRPIDVQQLSRIFATSPSMEKRLKILTEYNVQYIIVKDNDSLSAFYDKDPHFTIIQKVENFSIIEFREITPYLR